MRESGHSAEGQRRQLLEKLRVFEEIAETIHPEKHGSDTAENIVRFRTAAEDLRAHLSAHLASKETMEWPELPDSGAEVSAFAAELKLEHQELLNELGRLASTAGKLDEALDRADAATRLRQQSRILALRIARHAGEEETPLSHYL